MTSTTQSGANAGLQQILETRGLTRSFGTTLAVQPFDFSIPTADAARGTVADAARGTVADAARGTVADAARGTVVGLLGPNGSGKSTFMRMLTGLVRPDAGSARICGVELSGDGTAVRERVTYSPGELHMYGEMRASDHITWLLRGREASSRARALELADSLQLPLRKRVRTFSHGMKRQLVFAAAMAPAVKLRILDEPTEGLDPSKRNEVLELLRADAANGTTILLSSHHLGEVDRACERLVFFNAGRMIADETPTSVASRAGRTLRITWAREIDLEPLQKQLDWPTIESIQRNENVLAILLHDSDPRAFLAEFAARTDWPQPTELEHGQLSLHDLYRELYGVEGC